jgi:hypothetical protein
MTVRTLLSSLVLATALAGAAFAAGTDRYTLEQTEDGYVRLDTQTGEMSICKQNGAELVCRVAADERKALEDEIDRLAARLGDIEKRLTALESSPYLKPGELLPSEEHIDRSLDTMEKFFRRFMEVMRDVEKDSTRI